MREYITVYKNYRESHIVLCGCGFSMKTSFLGIGEVRAAHRRSHWCEALLRWNCA